MRFCLSICGMALSFVLFAQTADPYALAKNYFAQGEYEKALVYVKEAESKQFNTQVYELGLQTYIALDDYKEAQGWIEKNLRKNRLNPIQLQVDLIALHNRFKREDRAANSLENLLKEVEANPNYAFVAAKLLGEIGQPAAALQVYERAEKARPNLNFDYYKALLYGELGQTQRMYDMYADMLASSPNYLRNIQTLLGRSYQTDGKLPDSEYLKAALIQRIQEGGSPALNELLVYLFVQEQSFGQAFVQLRALDKRGLIGSKNLFDLGKIAYENEDYGNAIRIFEYISEKGVEDPFYAEAAAYRLHTRSAQLKAQQAGREEWLRLNQDYAQLRKQLNGFPLVADLLQREAHQLCFYLDRCEESVELLKSSLNWVYLGEEAIAQSKILLGDILLYQGDRWSAILYYGQAEKAFEQSPVGQEAKFKRAVAAYFVGDFAWAEGIFDVLKESTSKRIANDAMRYSLLLSDNLALDTNTEALEMYAQADFLQYQSNLDSALRLLSTMEIAYLDHPIQDEVLFKSAEIHYKKGNWTEAEAYWAEVVRAFPESILTDDALFLLAELYREKLGNTSEAMAHYERIFLEHPDSFFADEARMKFRSLRVDQSASPGLVN